MGLVPTLLAIGAGIALGVRWGGSVDRLRTWRPLLWQALAAGVSLTVLLDVLPLSGAFASFLRIVALGLLLGFAVLNVRTGGMVLVVAGLGCNLLVTVVNWGMPVSGSALVSAGLADEDQLGRVVLYGGREVADGAFLGFLGNVVPLPWGQVVSVGDLLLLAGLCLVSASVVRRYEVVGSSPFGPVGGGPSRVGPREYRDALDALGRGPAPRKGPGLHPSRLPGQRRTGGPGRQGPSRGGAPGRTRRPGPSGRGPGTPPR